MSVHICNRYCEREVLHTFQRDLNVDLSDEDKKLVLVELIKKVLEELGVD